MRASIARVALGVIVGLSAVACSKQQSLPAGVPRVINSTDTASIILWYPGAGDNHDVLCDVPSVGHIDVRLAPWPPGRRGEVDLAIAPETPFYVTYPDGSQYPEASLGPGTRLVLYPGQPASALDLTFSIEAIEPTGDHSGYVQIHVDHATATPRVSALASSEPVSCS